MQYLAVRYTERLAEAGAVPSVGSRGDSYDNALAESFFATLKLELVDRYTWPTRRQARTAIFEFIEGFYNRQRRHPTLGYRSPAEFEARYHAADPAA